MSEERVEKATIFIFGQLGEKLRELDDERLLAILQAKPDYFLGQKASQEIDELLDKLLADELTDEELDRALDLAIIINERDSIYREVARFMHDSDDMLSVGSMTLGELASSDAVLELFEKERKEAKK